MTLFTGAAAGGPPEPRAAGHSGIAARTVLGLFAGAGIAFWFIIGFPFGHHNESYSWAAHLHSIGWLESLTEKFPSVSGLRPLGTGLAWLLFHGSGGSIVPQQLVNFACAIAAWWLLVAAVPHLRLASLIACLAGAFFFPGYIYLFHIHGVFYGFAMIWLAAAVAACHAGLTPRRLALLAAGAWLAATFHPHVLILFAAATAGACLEFRAVRTRAGLAVALAVLLLTVQIARWMVPSHIVLEASERGLGIVTTFRTVELHVLISVVAAALAGWTTLGIRARPRIRIAAAAATSAASVLAIATGWPVLPLWIAASIVRAASHGRWTLAAMLAASLSFPYFSPTGTPTYTVMMLMLATAVAASNAAATERRLERIPLPAWAAAGAVALLPAIAVAAGMNVPGLSRLAKPLLAEKERTHQLESALDWLLASPHRQDDIHFASDAPFPIHSGPAIDRTHRPPAKDQNLQDYLTYVRGGAAPGANRVLIAFGGVRADADTVLRVIPGRYAGDAVVFVPPDAPRAGAP